MTHNSWKPWLLVTLLTAGLSLLPLPKLMGLLKVGGAVAAAQTAEDRKAEADQLLRNGAQQYRASQWQEAIQSWQAALQIYRETGVREAFPQESPVGEASTLNNIGEINRLLGNYPTALDYYEQSLALKREIGDRASESTTLNNIGVTYQLLGNYPTAFDYYEQSLALKREIGDHAGESTTLNNIGITYQLLGNYPIALDYYEQSLAVKREIGDRTGESKALGNIGIVYRLLGNYPMALNYYEKSLVLHHEIGDRAGEAVVLGNIGIVYQSLGDYPTALDHYEQSLILKREIGDRAGEADTLGNIGNVYQLLEDYPTALNYYEQSLALKREIGNRAGEADTLGNSGIVYQLLEDYPTALNYYEQSLALKREIGDRAGEANTLNNIGEINRLLENYLIALNHYEKSLIIKQEIGDRAGEADTLSNIGRLLTAQNHTELAIVFLKQSVNKYETIREDLKNLPDELQDRQQTYTATIENTYRALADLLLQQGRILEAQQVLDLLKVQELDDYLRGVRGPEDTLTILRPEQEILQRFDAQQQTAIGLGRQIAALRQRLYEQGTLPPTDEQELDRLVTAQEALNNQFSAFLKSSEIQALANQLSPENKPTLEAAQRDALFQALDDLQDDLQDINAVLLYPLILEDRLELIITLPDPETTPLRRTVPLEDSADLTRAISELRQALRDPNADAITPAQTLYQYLIAPLEADLAEVATKLTDGTPPTILYAPDGALRYIPLAALHDGDQWLAQRFRINTITAESLTEFQSPPPRNPRVLAGAFADPSITYTVPVGGQPADFSGLPFAGQEVENLAASPLEITHFMDGDFGWAQIRRLMGGANILHLATHAAFDPRSPEDSFILFGNGDRAVLDCLDEGIQTEDDRSCINNWQLNNVDLVVLSACETGVGGASLSAAEPNSELSESELDETLYSGKEILGLGYQFQSRGARAVVASLWKVSDGGTQALMDAFYGALQQPEFSKSEALRLAQEALITGDFSVLGLDERGAVALRLRIEQTVPTAISTNLNHPYYWAPFILIGNGL
ncbi:MAG: tetratricopeptide repeat protein [Cyanobacteria bacterium P01_A01_bin.135]